MKNINKKSVFNFILVISLILNLFQYLNFLKEKDKILNIDSSFQGELHGILNASDNLSKNDSEPIDLILLSSSVSKASILSNLTSFNKENNTLYNSLFTLNNLLNNNNNFENSFKNIDFYKLNLIIYDIYQDPSNEETTKNLLEFASKCF